MTLISHASNAEQMRNEIANYLAAQAENFASRKMESQAKHGAAQYEMIREALMQIAETVKGIRIEPKIATEAR